MAKKKLYTITLTLPDGKRKYYRGKTKKEAEAKRDKDKALLGRGIDISDNRTFKEVAEFWFALMKEDHVSTRTKELIRGIMDKHVYPVIGEKKIREVLPADIMLLMKTAATTASKSWQTKILTYTKAVFAFAVDNDLIVKTPVWSSIKPIGEPAKEVQPLTDAQCEALLRAVKGTRAYLFVELLLYTGLRRGEALGLMWSDIDFDQARLTVNRSVVYTDANKDGEINPDLKTMNARREVPIVPWLLEDLRTAKEASRSLYVFSMRDGSFLSRPSFRSMWEIVERRTGDLGFSVHPHQLRHTCITRWVERGIDPKIAQDFAGHATAMFTMNTYVHFRKEDRWQQAAELMAQAVAR